MTYSTAPELRDWAISRVTAFPLRKWSCYFLTDIRGTPLFAMRRERKQSDRRAYTDTARELEQLGRLLFGLQLTRHVYLMQRRLSDSRIEYVVWPRKSIDVGDCLDAFKRASAWREQEDEL